ncbi:MAG: excinuclease ABC subunit UvrA [Flavobacteriaceae bacterium]
MSKQETVLDLDKAIYIKGAKLHNLKNIDVAIPRNQLVVITGVSGSGKSSLAFDTLYAEGQRRYVESLSSYARQFLGKLNKPQVDSIQGISPAIAIEQKVNATNPRSTVGTSTEIYDYLKLLYARIGKTYSPVSGDQVKIDQVSDVMKYIEGFEPGLRYYVLAPIETPEGRSLSQHLKLLEDQGYARVKHEGEIVRINKLEAKIKDFSNTFLVVDRGSLKLDEDSLSRLADSVQTAFFEGKGFMSIQWLDNENTTREFSNRFELDGITFNQPNDHFFSFNNPYGACPKCEGYGNIVGIDENLVIPNTDLSIYDQAISPWKSDSFKKYYDKLIAEAYKYDIPIHKAWHELSEEQKSLVFQGTKTFKGIDAFFKFLEEKSYKIQYRVMLSRYRGKTTCTVCKGRRLRKETNYVKIGGKNISELVILPMDELQEFFKNLQLDQHDTEIAKRILFEIESRIGFLLNVGLSYLTLNRASNTLSGGESQRINLATSLGSSLVGSMYILDEPSIGLHPKDSERLIEVLKELRDLGNTVIVVEHDEDIMKQADYIIDIGPEAGRYGGQLVAEGTYNEFLKQDSLTSKYLTGALEIKVPKKRKKVQKKIVIKGARAHNLKNIDVDIPLNNLTVITGVSGSGKSSLVKRIIYPAIKRELDGFGLKSSEFSDISGDLKEIEHIEYIDQNPIGRSSRSNPVTYIKAYDDIRSLFAKHSLSKARHYQPKHFSFNVDGGRCENCKGEGQVTIEMQFMADVHLTCEVCKGKRFKKEILEVKIDDKSIDDILNLTISEALEFFEKHGQSKLLKKLQPLEDVGLGYVQLGQSSSTLSGGEAQRIKLASFLVKGNSQSKSLFIFDEPTTGLHFHDIKKLLNSFSALIKNGHSLLVIEHNIDLIKCADYLIDLGPEGGKNGGNLLFQGTPEDLITIKGNYTAKYLEEKLN